MFVPDAYLLSFSKDAEFVANKFGPCVVEIRKPSKLIERVGRALFEQGVEAMMRFDRVLYTTRDYDAADDPPDGIAFPKPEKFSEDKEYRMVWEPREVDKPLERLVIRSEWAGNLCARVR